MVLHRNSRHWWTNYCNLEKATQVKQTFVLSCRSAHTDIYRCLHIHIPAWNHSINSFVIVTSKKNQSVVWHNLFCQDALPCEHLNTCWRVFFCWCRNAESVTAVEELAGLRKDSIPRYKVDIIDYKNMQSIFRKVISEAPLLWMLACCICFFPWWSGSS